MRHVLLLLLLLRLVLRRIRPHSEAQPGVRGHEAEVVLRREPVAEKPVGLLQRRQKSLVRKVALVVARKIVAGSAEAVVVVAEALH